MQSLWLQAALTAILRTGRVLDRVKLDFHAIGSSEDPVQALALAPTRELRLTGRHGCHVVAERGVPLAWRSLGIASAQEVTLEFKDGPDFLLGLDGLCISCKALVGPTCFRLAHALGKAGVNPDFMGDRHNWLLGRFRGVRGRTSYDLLNDCTCQACLSCLQRAGKLPEGSIVPEDYNKEA